MLSETAKSDTSYLQQVRDRQREGSPRIVFHGLRCSQYPRTRSITLRDECPSRALRQALVAVDRHQSELGAAYHRRGGPHPAVLGPFNTYSCRDRTNSSNGSGSRAGGWRLSNRAALAGSRPRLLPSVVRLARSFTACCAAGRTVRPCGPRTVEPSLAISRDRVASSAAVDAHWARTTACSVAIRPFARSRGSVVR